MTSAAASRQVELAGLDGQRLAGILDLPDGEVRATALFAHCFTCSSRSHAAARISRALAAEGVAVLRIDFTGLGESGGDFADTGFGTNVEDLLAAASWLTDEVGSVDLLVGHSLGGAAVIAAAARLPGVRAVVTVGAPASPEHVAHLVSELTTAAGDDAAGQDEPVEVDIGGRPFRLRRSFLDEVRSSDQESRIAELRRPLLVLHSPIDAVVGVENARRIFDTAKHPKSFVALDGADHLVSDEADARWIGAMIATWMARYVVPDAAAAPELAPTVEEGLVVTELDAAQGYAHRAATPTHDWLLDEPVEAGGEDTGPTPYDQLLAALGACTSMTMRMYARRKGWAVGGLEVRLRHGKVHAADCADCETKSGQVDVIDREVVLPEGLDPEQREALLRIADRCPVHRTLTREVLIRTTAP